MHLAVSINNAEIVKLLLSQENLDVNQKTFNFSCYIIPSDWSTSGTMISALYMAIENKNYEIIQLLLERPDIDINLENTIINQNF